MRLSPNGATVCSLFILSLRFLLLVNLLWVFFKLLDDCEFCMLYKVMTRLKNVFIEWNRMGLFGIKAVFIQSVVKRCFAFVY